MLSNIALIASILTALFTFVSFGIKAFTGRHAEDVFHEIIRRPVRSQPFPQLGTPPAQQSSSVVVGKRSLRGLIPHPWLLGVYLLGLLLLFVPATLGQSDNPIAIVGLLIFLASWISSAVIAVRGRNWVWFVVMIVTFGYAVLFFCIFARPKKQVSQLSQGPAA